MQSCSVPQFAFWDEPGAEELEGGSWTTRTRKETKEHDLISSRTGQQSPIGVGLAGGTGQVGYEDRSTEQMFSGTTLQCSSGGVGSVQPGEQGARDSEEDGAETGDAQMLSTTTLQTKGQEAVPTHGLDDPEGPPLHESQM